MTLGSIFSGIGGFDLGAQRAGLEISWQIEIDPYCRAVLRKHWPTVKRYGDVKTVKTDQLQTVNIVCGGPPCQPFSIAGKRTGWEDPRNLWPEFIRIIEGIRPDWVVAENSTQIIQLGYDKIASSLESMGYEVGALCIPACAIGAPHIRERIWIIANSQTSRCTWNGRKREECSGRGFVNGSNEEDISNSAIRGVQGNGTDWFKESQTSLEQKLSGFRDSGRDWRKWEVEPLLRRMDDGVSEGLDEHWRSRIQGLGNAVVPQIPELLFTCIKEIEDDYRIHRPQRQEGSA